MILLLFSLMILSPDYSFKHYSKKGNGDICLVNYQTKSIDCSYKTMKQCRDQYETVKGTLCFSRKSLKLEGDN